MANDLGATAIQDRSTNRRRFDVLSDHGRVWTTIAVLAVASTVLGWIGGLFARNGSSGNLLSMLASLDASFVAFLVLTLAASRREPQDRIMASVTARRKTLRSRLHRFFIRTSLGIPLVVMVATTAVLAAALVLPRTEDLFPDAPGLLVVLSVALVVLAWFIVHIIYAEHYAELYYRDNNGLKFGGDQQPNYVDFMYFSFSVGMTFGTTDVGTSSRAFRRAMLPHKLFSFGYNTAILALMFTILFR